MTLIERTWCPFCEYEIQKTHDKEDRLYGSERTCPKCKETFIVSCTSIQSEEQIATGDYSVIVPVRQKKTYNDKPLEQSTLEACDK